MLGDEAERANIRVVTHDLLGYLADDPSEARTYRVAACQAASEAGHPPLIAQALVGVSDLALRCEQYEQAARLLAASADVRGLPDRSHPDLARIEQTSARRISSSATRFGGARSRSSESHRPGGHARFLNVASAHRYPTRPIPTDQAIAAIASPADGVPFSSPRNVSMIGVKG